MKIGAATLIREWGRPMSLKRDGVIMVDFLGRRYEYSRLRETEPLDYSVDQDLFNIIAAYEDLLGVDPQKFDVILFNGHEYTVQHSHAAGADENEVIRMLVKGGLT